MEIALLLGLVSTPILGQVFTWLPEVYNISDLSGVSIYKEFVMDGDTNKVVIAICHLFRDCIFSLIFYSFYRFFKDMKIGDIFNQKQIKRIYISGWYFIVLFIYSTVTDMFFSLLQEQEGNAQYYFQIDNLIYIPLGIGLIILGHILHLATEIKEEQEMVI
ncbi:TPA: DUF2975 domain-containing protein [Providencia alcalifaciens]